MQNKQQNQYFLHWERWRVFRQQVRGSLRFRCRVQERGAQAARPLSASIQRFDYIQLTDIYGAPSTCQTLLGEEGQEGRMRGPGAGRSECIEGERPLYGELWWMCKWVREKQCLNPTIVGHSWCQPRGEPDWVGPPGCPWIILWAEGPGRLQLIGSQRVEHN